MKLYKNLVNSIAQTLQEIFTGNRYADRALEKLFRQNPQWGSRDRRFVAEGVYDIVRNFRLFSTLAESEKNFWFITAVWLVIKNIPLPDWQEFRDVNPELILKHRDRLKNNTPVFESYPDWLWQLGEEELGIEAWSREARAMNMQAPVYLRANSIKTSRKKLAETFLLTKTETKEVLETKDGLELLKRENLFRHQLFKDGWFEVQDAGSQMISEFLSPKAGELVVDACAGGGGKSLHLSALMNNKGKVISMDVEEWKLAELKKRAKRAGAFNIETRLIIDGKTINDMKEKADRLLLDVPCSGLGVLKRNPDAKWKLSAEVILRTKAVQRQILNEYPAMLKKGGLMVYSTCSLLPSENQEQVAAFLKEHSNFMLENEKTLLPSKGFDGFYMALIKKTA